jgi:hypothetical protein
MCGVLWKFWLACAICAVCGVDRLAGSTLQLLSCCWHVLLLCEALVDALLLCTVPGMPWLALSAGCCVTGQTTGLLLHDTAT